MLDLLRPLAPILDGALAASLARAAASLARLDQAAANHLLRPALLYRTRLEAVRRQAIADGRLIDPWHLAAIIEGLRLRMDHTRPPIDRGSLFEATRHALDQYQWLVGPDFDQEGEVQTAENHLARQSGTPLLAAAAGLRQWIEGGGTRPPLRAALVRFWVKQRVLRLPVPLTGARALHTDVAWHETAWLPTFLTALADEADDALDLLFALEHAWTSARRAVAGRRRHSRAAVAIDILAAAPLISATSLAAALDMAVKNASALLEEFRRAGIAVEVTHRSKRRLFGLAGLAPLRDVVRPPDRPDPRRGRGRPRHDRDEDVAANVVQPEPPGLVSLMDRRQFDYSDFERWMTHMDQTIRHARRVLRGLSNPAGATVALAGTTEGADSPTSTTDAIDRSVVAER